MLVDWKPVLRDVLIVLLLAALGRIAANAMLGESEGARVAVGNIAILCMIAGFCIGGCLVPVRRFRHLAIVALGVWLAGPIMRFGQEGSLASWIVFLIPTFLAMGIGGAISLLIVRPPRSEPSAPPPAQP